MLKQARFHLKPPGITRQSAASSDHAVAGNKNGYGIAVHSLPYRSGRCSKCPGYLSVSNRGAEADGHKECPHISANVRPLGTERRERQAFSGKVGIEPLSDRCDTADIVDMADITDRADTPNPVHPLADLKHSYRAVI